MDRVGARQEQMDLFPEGGRYPDNCTDSKLPPGAKAPEKSARFFAELDQIKLPPFWKELAERLGPDEFLDIWRMLDDHIESTDDRRLYIPKFGTYERYQRNLMILSLQETGKKPRMIQQKLKDRGHNLSMRTIERVLQS